MSTFQADDNQGDGLSALARLTTDELRDVIRQRLHGRRSIGPPVDVRVGPEAFEWLSEEFRRGDAGLQHRMTAVLRDFLGELADVERWPEEARFALLDLIQDCGEGLVDDLFRMIRQQTLLRPADLGPDAHAGLLKCLIANGHHATPEFWLEQFHLLGPDYGALIFSGLVDHGLELAMGHLPELTVNDEARQYVRWLFPHLKDKFGVQTVVDALDRQQERLAKETYRLYRSDLGMPVGGCEPDESVAAGSRVAKSSGISDLVESAKKYFARRSTKPLVFFSA
jgi:hypothetical protein